MKNYISLFIILYFLSGFLVNIAKYPLNSLHSDQDINVIQYKIKSQLFEGSPNQFNLYAKIGPNVDGGIILSGHTDVVPTDGQNWSTNPFELVKKKKNYLEEVLAI